MEKEKDEVLNKIVEKLNRIENRQEQIIHQIVLLPHTDDNYNLPHLDKQILEIHKHKIKFLMDKVKKLEEEIFMLKKLRAEGK